MKENIQKYIQYDLIIVDNIPEAIKHARFGYKIVAYMGIGKTGNKCLMEKPICMRCILCDEIEKNILEMGVHGNAGYRDSDGFLHNHGVIGRSL